MSPILFEFQPTVHLCCVSKCTCLLCLKLHFAYFECFSNDLQNLNSPTISSIFHIRLTISDMNFLFIK